MGAAISMMLAALNLGSRSARRLQRLADCGERVHSPHTLFADKSERNVSPTAIIHRGGEGLIPGARLGLD
jgi:hypothetical protein